MTSTIPVEPTLNIKLQARPPPSKNTAMHMKLPFRLQNMRLDPSRALEPSRKKLTTVEAQRVMAVFEDTIRRVEIVTLLPYLMANLDRYRVSLGGELVELVQHHAVIIASYDDIRQELDQQLERRATLRPSPAPSEDGEKAAPSEDGEKAAPEGQDEADVEPIEVCEDGEGGEGTSVRQGAATSVRSATSARSAGEQSADSQMEATMRNLSLVAQQMSHSTRNILRAFTLNPAVMSMITGMV